MADHVKPVDAGTYIGPVKRDRTSISEWNPEDEKFWESTGKYVARRNLIWSIARRASRLCDLADLEHRRNEAAAGRLSLHHGPTLSARSDARTDGLAGPFPVRLRSSHVRRPQLDHRQRRVAFHPHAFARLFRDAARHSVLAYVDRSGDRWVWRRQFRLQHGQHILLLPRPHEGLRARLERRPAGISASASCSFLPRCCWASALSIFTWQPPPRTASISRTPD